MILETTLLELKDQVNYWRHPLFPLTLQHKKIFHRYENINNLL